MDELDQEISDLLTAVHKTQIYQEFRKQETILKQDHVLYERVMQFRADNFRLQRQANESNLLEVVGGIYQESRQLRKNTQVNAYLDAELALCKLLQKIARRIVDGIEIDVPDVG
ncbi:MAG: YlbF family regulator [Blautia sp.]|nr:YlbF family regulator [Blautia sp.]